MFRTRLIYKQIPGPGQDCCYGMLKFVPRQGEFLQLRGEVSGREVLSVEWQHVDPFVDVSLSLSSYSDPEGNTVGKPLDTQFYSPRPTWGRRAGPSVTHPW